jgi:hypothetical protein
MKNKLFILIITIAAISFSSCKVNTFYKEARYGHIVLDSLKRSDVEVVGQCTAEAFIVKDAKGLTAKYAKQYKQGRFDNFLSIAVEQEKDPITNFLSKIRAALVGAQALVQDPGRDFVMYALYEKYPNVDYFAGVTINREITTTMNKLVEEKLFVKAIGIKLKTDK